MRGEEARVSQQSDLETRDGSNLAQRFDEPSPEDSESHGDIPPTSVPSNPGSSRVLRPSTVAQRVRKLISTGWNILTFLSI